MITKKLLTILNHKVKLPTLNNNLAIIANEGTY